MESNSKCLSDFAGFHFEVRQWTTDMANLKLPDLDVNGIDQYLF